MTTIIEDQELVPFCPHCGARLEQVFGRTVGARGSAQFRFGKRYIYSCPSCRKALGISHRKGFWAG